VPAAERERVASVAVAQPPSAPGRRVAAWILGLGWLAAYNWWILVPFKPGLMRSPDEFFSNLEVTGQPYAAAMQHADVAAGLLLLGAFLLAGRAGLAGGRREWLGMVTFAVGGAVGGLFPQVCADGISATCMSMEWHFQLSPSQYVHDGSGVVEFAGITLALLLAVRRTRRRRTAAAWTYRGLVVAAAVGYPLLAAAYLLNKFGGIIEAVFFVGFSIMIVTQLAERLSQQQPPAEPAASG
jgi:hypothetical protein